MDLSNVSDEALLGRVEALARTERVGLIEFLIHLGELDLRKKACLDRGFPSVFAYLTRRLGHAESDAIRRLRAARAGRDYPSVMKHLAAGELNIVGISMLQPLLTSENHQGLIRKAIGRSTREIERLVAELSPPISGPKDRIRALPAPHPRDISAPASPSKDIPMLELESEPETRASIEPSPARVVFTFTASEEVRDLFEQARDLLRHRFPFGAIEDIVGEALRRLIEKERPGLAPPKKRRAAKENGVHRRRVPKWVEDEVWRRDGGRCAFTGGDGVRCGETSWLELDHAIPFALGGPSDDPANVRLLCRAHNHAEGRRAFGEKRSPAARA